MWSDYVVYVDETGDHSLDSINRDFPLFGLSFCVFAKDVYCRELTPPIRELKFATFGHDMVVLHEHDIRKKRGAFSRMGKERREGFLNKLTGNIDRIDFMLVAVVIDKERLKERYTYPAHPYHLAMEYGLERVYRFLREKNQDGRTTHVIFEALGKNEDATLELEFRRVCDGANYFRQPLPFEIILADKRVNSEGLQMADMTARPVALSVLRPGQPNRAMDVLEHKFYRDGGERKEGFGLKVFP